ncbi:MAG: heme ABC exporter ATP-binding protein CcmA [Burkholderiaceae bacterium]
MNTAAALAPRTAIAWGPAGLACDAGDRPLFAGVGWQLQPGQWISLTGRNGVGKTTLLRALAGLVRPVAGQVQAGGRTIDPRAPRWRAGLLYLGHAAALKGSLDTTENLATWLDLDLAPAATPPLAPLLDRAGLARRGRVSADRLSAGQKKRVQLARLAVSVAPIWLLDEPTNALDRDGIVLLEDLLQAHLQAGGSAVIASHQPVGGATPTRQFDLGEFAIRRSRR